MTAVLPPADGDGWAIVGYRLDRSRDGARRAVAITRRPDAELIHGRDTDGVIVTRSGRLPFEAVDGVPRGFRHEAAVRFSPDGARWEKVRADGLLGAESSAIDDCAAGPAGFVAVGLRDGGAAVWTSPDGFSWRPGPNWPAR